MSTERQPPAQLPCVQMTQLALGFSLLLPLTHRGYGPGLILLSSDSDEPCVIIDGVPSPLAKWAEEGYTVVEIQERALTDIGPSVLISAVEALRSCNKCNDSGKIGLVSYVPKSWNKVAPHLVTTREIICAVIYGDAADKANIASAPIHILQHLAGSATFPLDKSNDAKVYLYPRQESFLFATPFQDTFHYWTEVQSHTRSLTFLKATLGGPYFDLEAIWDEHTDYEFSNRSVEHTMSTMVQEPYVNHVPSLTGGIGRVALSHFYRHNFIFNNAEDTELELISRTIGIDRVIDEFIMKITHDREIDWLIPGIPPTYKKAEIPFTAVVNIRGDRLYHEHISWDQGTVLAQLGLMPEYLPFPYPLEGGRTPMQGQRFEYRVPIAGIQTADKMRDRNSVPSNQMFEFRIREVSNE
ncbi:hypothetical protein BGW36DRAFT_422619 [Talaromyces proteolyticus]|uniref:Carboxymethylenebutenolidase n=1 Tax=Talaromyces proteolyticus TaxID=1131652 RepID=A0AAD4PZI8_9EURO|nr:uncharacterized protein BGW36DRAFT_422619 [Talaromyces proteolyticus]KAH8703038.1 hypothetical protein BGW36DRAFT_422619 [Talaromyces proteolyticus]